MTQGLLEAKLSRPLEGGPSYTLSNRLYRLAWQTVWALFARWLPGGASPWRVLLLRAFGANVSWRAAIGPNVEIWHPRNLRMDAGSTLGPGVRCYNMAMITIGERVIVSQGAHLCAGSHDVDDEHFQLTTSPIFIRRGAWIAAEAFIGPGVVIGEGAVLGARAVAFSDLEANGIYVGNPARIIRHRRRP